MTPQNIKFLQLTIPSLEYPGLVDQRYSNPIYWEWLPTYLIARCPLCGALYTSKLDPHSLHGWGTGSGDTGRAFYTDKHEQVGCDHRVAVQMFVNLEGHVPSELNGYKSELHIPFVAPFFVPNDIKSALAVIHSFALCRLEDEQGRIYHYHRHAFEEPVTAEVMRSREFKWRDKQRVEQRSAEDTAALEKAVFVPRYTAYAVTYYAESPQILVNRRMDPQKADAESDDRYWPVFLPSMGEVADTRAFDLLYWVKRGKLKWLDLESPDLRLRVGPAKDFPYVDIHDISGELRQFKI